MFAVGNVKIFFYIEEFAVHNSKICLTIQVNLILMVTSGLQSRRLTFLICGVE